MASLDRRINRFADSYCLIAMLLVTLGVAAHVPMFVALIEHKMCNIVYNYAMLAGMCLIVVGMIVGTRAVVMAGSHELRRAMHVPPIAPWVVLMALFFALVIDIQKPATLAFVVPGMMHEYGVSEQYIALLPLCALTGTVVGSLIWGRAAATIGRRGSVLLATLMFTATSVCGAMPSLVGNIIMCSMMGVAAGGMVPVVYAILEEILPKTGRMPIMVMFGTVAGLSGYLLASASAAYLEPSYGWRVLWAVGLPTGVLLFVLISVIPREWLWPHVPDKKAERQTPSVPRLLLVALNCGAFTWSCVNYAFLFWLPTQLHDLGVTSLIGDNAIMISSLLSVVAAPLIVLLLLALGDRSLVAALACSIALVLLSFAADPDVHNITFFSLRLSALLLVSNGFIYLLLPFSAGIQQSTKRTWGMGIIAASSKNGGVVALAMSAFGFTPTLRSSAQWICGVACICALVLTFAIVCGRRNASMV